LLDQDSREKDHYQREEDDRGLTELRGQPIHYDKEAEVGMALHAHRRPQKGQPDEADPRNLVVPGKGPDQHIPGENAEKQVDGENDHQGHADPLHGVRQDSLQHGLTSPPSRPT
jgi:hypothetical protein